MNRIKIRIDTMSDVSKLVAVATKAKGRVILTDNNDFKVNGKSLLGAIYPMEWSEVYQRAVRFSCIILGEHFYVPFLIFYGSVTIND